MKKKVIEGRIYYEMDETDYDNLKDDNIEFIKSLNITKDGLFKVSDTSDTTFKESDLNDACSDDDEVLEPIIITESDDGCEIDSGVVDDDEIILSDFEFELPYNDAPECRAFAERVAGEMSDLANQKIALMEKMGKVENKYFHFRIGGILFERIRYYHANKQLLSFPTDWDIGTKFSSRKLQGLIKGFRAIYNNQSDYIIALIKPIDYFLEVNYKNSIPERGNIYEYYSRTENYVTQLSEDARKVENAASIVQGQLDYIKDKYINQPYIKLRDLVEKYAKEVAISDHILSNGNMNTYLKTTYLNIYDNILDAWIKVKGEYETLLKELEVIEGKILAAQDSLMNLPCKQEPSDKIPKVDAGSGMDSYDWGVPNADDNIPTITDYLYWLRYCGIASIVGLIPIHWAVGILVPNPSGLTKIPFPTIFIPLAVFSTPVGLFVIILGQCGLMPSPLIFHWNPSDQQAIVAGFESKFLVTLRGSQDISTNSGNNILMAAVPHVDENGTLTPPQPIPDVTGVKDNINSNLTNLDPSAKVFPFGTLLPTQDDFPVWERLSPINILFLKYLNDWNSANKKGSGFFENP